MLRTKFFRNSGRYGYVVSEKDWLKIKKKDPMLYQYLIAENNEGHCYFVSWALALQIHDAKLMYCCVLNENGILIGKATITKGNWIYDPNLGKHFKIEEYQRRYQAKVYKIFERKEFRSINFFDTIKEEFEQWCSEKGAYCSVQ